jgi:DNA-binding transcriptional LysR family regulator
VRIVRLRDSSLVARRLAPSRSILCAAPDYLTRRGTPRSLEDLAGHECLLYSYQATGDSWRFQGPGGERRIRLSGRLRANSGDALLQAAAAGLGIALLPSFICYREVCDGRLVQVLPEWNARSGIDINAVYPANRNLSPKVRVFIDFLAARFGPRPYWDEGLGA